MCLVPTRSNALCLTYLISFYFYDKPGGRELRGREVTCLVGSASNQARG